MQAENIKTLSFGCRLNSLESEKIQNMLSPVISCAIVVNTCSVTAEAERQSAQAIRKLARENPSAPIFITGCVATRNPTIFSEIPNTIVIDNKDKMNLDAYLTGFSALPCHENGGHIDKFASSGTGLSKKFIQIQNGCNHNCSYCVTRLLRGKNVSFSYESILSEAKQAITDRFYEIVLTGVDIAEFNENGFGLSDLCKKLLNDVPEIKRLRLSSIDPASPEILKIIELMKSDNRMMQHLHLSMQSGSDTILRAMRRRHTTDMVRKFVKSNPDISFSLDLICGFPGETDELFAETCALINELKFIKIHAFPFSPRPNTDAATMPDQVNRVDSKKRVKIASEISDKNKLEFMQSKIGTICQVLVENKNIARTPDDIELHIQGEQITPKTVCNVEIISISDLHFIGKVC